MLSFRALANKVFGDPNVKRLRQFDPVVAQINALEPEMEAMSDDDLRGQTAKFRQELENGRALDDLIVPSFATVREAAKRTLGQRHYDVQLIGGMVLNAGGISEMKTGEGKTLVATLPVYLNALPGRGVHVVTVNDYLATRDAEWMGQIYRFLGLEVGCIVNDMDHDARLKAYASDVTYATNNELGFDYLRDNMAMSVEEMVQFGGRSPDKIGHAYAIVDEVDSILIDEARTPLIISGPVEDRSELYTAIDHVIPKLEPEDYEVDEKTKQVALTERGNETVEVMLREAEVIKDSSLYDVENVSIVHHINQALKAHTLFKKDRDYIVRRNEVVIIDEFTGRMMPGRRYSDGLHQALEAKESVAIQPENQTLASITFQNYFRLYDKLGGMTGTAATEAEEFLNIYGLQVYEIPTNRPISRIDDDDEVYRTQDEKFRAIIALIADCHRRGQPILVGTTSIAKSEILSEHLKDRAYLEETAKRIEGYAAEIKEGTEDAYREFLQETAAFLHDLVAKSRKGKNAAPIPHQVLNARYHEQEAKIIAQAGVPGAVTIATNMAGRGTDIQLGGNLDMMLTTWAEEQAEAGRSVTDAEMEEKRTAFEAEIQEKKNRALEAGGLYVVGTERHESRRIDNQLRGRSGRQGDPGHSKFFLSLEDDLMRIFGSDRMEGMLRRLGLKDGEAIIHPWINKALEKAQSKVEARNFDARKNILKYDDVMNDQRKVIFEQRIDLMTGDDVSETVADMRHSVIDQFVSEAIPKNAYAEQWDVETLHDRVQEVFGLDVPVKDWAAEEGIADEEMRERLIDAADKAAARKASDFGREQMRTIEKMVLLQTLDHLWREHIVTLEHLREVVQLRGFGQRDPLNEYKSEGFALFESMLNNLRVSVTTILMNVQMRGDDALELPEAVDVNFDEMEFHHDEAALDNAPYPDQDELYDGYGHGHAHEQDGELLERQAPVRTRKAAAQVNPDDPTTWGKVARNALCPCGSGKKYKHCHGRI